MCNKDIKQLLKSKGIYQWQLAEKLGTSEYSFSRKMRKELPKEEKEKRLYKLNEIVNTYFKENNEKLVGKILPVLVEGISDKKNEYFGYSDTNKLVNFTGEDIEIGSIVDVEITTAKTWSLDGKVNK